MNTDSTKLKLAWLRLLRVPNLPTAISNILMGYLLAHQSWNPSTPLLMLILASSCLYLAGMVLNDFFDVEVDTEQRSNRPIPSGQIQKSQAGVVGFGLLALGILFAMVAGYLSSSLLRPTIIASLIAICVFLYDGPLKRTIAAPFLMGDCRFLNVLLGASTISVAGENFFLGFPPEIWWVAISIGVLIAGTTLLGRKEAVKEQSKVPLVVAGFMMLAGLVGLATVVYCPSSLIEVSEGKKSIYPLFIALIAFPIIRRVVEAVFTAKPKSIQAAIISVLRSLIILDAAVCYFADSSHPEYAFAVLLFLIPTYALGKYIPST